MILCKDKKLLFVAVPKTGSTSIGNALLGVLGNQNCIEHFGEAYHLPAKVLKNIKFKDNDLCWNSYFKFAFVRNPWCRAVSSYHYVVKTLENFKDPKLLTEWEKHCSTVLDTARKPLSFKELLTSDKFSWFCKPQDLWTHNVYGDILLDFIGKFENLQQDFNIICDKIGIPQQQLAHVNKTKHKHYTEYYDDETKQIVAEKYAKDIEYFGYKFGN